MITFPALRAICPLARTSAIARFVEPLDLTVAEFEITPPQRLPMFLAHLAHESGSFKYTRELASGAAYEGRLDLGNTEPGDGCRFPGRGPMQITGRKNTRLCSLALFGDERLLVTPELLEEPAHGARAAGWFWRVGAGLNLGKRAKAAKPILIDGVDLNDVADTGDFEATTMAINGWLNGIEDRRTYWERARKWYN